MKKQIVIFIGLLLCTGCALTTVTRDQVVRLDTPPSLTTVKCNLESNKGNWTAIPGVPVTIRRSPGDLKISCGDSVGQVGEKIVESSMQWEFFWIDFFLIDACTFSCIVDYSSGAFFEYPAVIHIDMGRANSL